MTAWNPTVYARDIPDACRTQIDDLRAAGHRLLCVAFPAAGGNRWSIITDRTFVNANIPQPCHDRMVALRDAGHRLLCVAFPVEGGNRWCIVTDRDVASRGLPPACTDTIRALRADGHRIVWVAFAGPGERWSIVTDRDVVSRGVPGECETRLQALRAAGERVVSVAFPLLPGLPIGGRRFSIVTASGAFFNRDTPPGCHRVMRAMSRLGVGRIASVAFAPGGGHVVIADGPPAGVEHAVLADGAERFSLTRFAEALREQLEVSAAVKAGFVVRYGTAVRAWAGGPARVAGDTPARPFSVFDWFNPASVTKPITAVALLRALHERGLGTDTRIWRWLPSNWTIPASVRTITVSELLNHRSGFRGGLVRYAELRTMVEAGIDLADKVYDYDNTNYAVARLLVATLSGRSPREGTGAILAALTAGGFRSYCQERIFDALGIPGVQWKPDADAPTLFYPHPARPFAGTTYGDWTSRPGCRGVHLSLAEFTGFTHALTTGEALLPASLRAALETEELGWYASGEGRSARHSHGGFFPGSRNGGAQLHSALFAFTNGVHGALVLNGDNEVVGLDLQAAYDAAWAVPTRRLGERARRVTPSALSERVRRMRALPGWAAEG